MANTMKQTTLPKITFVTSNKHKIREVTQILNTPHNLNTNPHDKEDDYSSSDGEGFSIPIQVIQHLDLPELQGSIEEIAVDKCRRAARAINGPVLIEDSALIFHGLGNGDLPGPYIKPFFGSLGNLGLTRLLADFPDKSATAVCTFAFSWGPPAPAPAPAPAGPPPSDTNVLQVEPEVMLFQGRNQGRIVSPRGANGFAFDPIFEFEGKTYAELDPVVKNVTSDRYKGLMKLKMWLAEWQAQRNRMDA